MKYMMSPKEMGRLSLIQGALDGVYTVRDAAKRLGLSERRVKQLKREFRSRGEAAVIHGNAGKHPANYTDEGLRKRIIDLKKSSAYGDANFTYFRELLEEREDIQVSYATVCRILKAAGIQSNRKHRGGGKRFKRRTRRSRFGELLQADATPFDWFGTGERSALHGFIDDAAGKIIALYLCKNECLMGYIELVRQTLGQYGLPIDIYADKAGIFFVNTKKKANWTVEETLAGHPLTKTQFGTIADKLGIGLISAHTPQAKGRIERLWETLQGRLPIWFALNGITDMVKANAALPAFITEYNRKFAVEPETSEDAFIPLSA
jgi:transposase